MAQWTGDVLDLSFEGIDDLDVRIVGGEVNVTTGTGPARIEVEVRRGPPADVRFEAGRLVVVHEPTRTLMGLVAGGIKAVVNVVVPEETPVAVRTVSGGAFVAGVRGVTTVTTVSGPTTITGLDGEITLRSVSGDIEAQGIDGSLHVTSVSGDVTITAGTMSSIRAKTVSGDVTLDLQSVPDVDGVSVSGDFALRLPVDAAFDIEVATVSGHLDTNFPDDDLQIGRRQMRGRVGLANIDSRRMAIRTTSGNVAFVRSTEATAGVESEAVR